MESNKSEVKAICQNCGKYDRCTKKCADTNKYTARKKSCEKFKEVQ